MNCAACDQPAEPSDQWCTSCGARLVGSNEEPRAALAKKAPTTKGGVGGLEPPALLNETAPSVDASHAENESVLRERLAAGTIVDQKYRVRRVLGEGAMGVVYLAEDIHVGIDVVLKAMRPELAHRADVRERTLAEGRALARIDHPNVVQLRAIVSNPEAGLWLVMQYIEGESLDATIKRHNDAGENLPFALVLDVFKQVLRGVGAAHAEGVIHRDIKPANILIRRKDGVAKITDFGIAKPEEKAREGQGSTKGVIGSLWYMSPEQVKGQRDLDKRLDIYALGIVLFELLTGRVPFVGTSSYEIMRQHVEEPLPRVRALRDDVPVWIDEVLARSTAKNRDDRFGSCEELLAAIETHVALHGGAAPAATLPGSTLPGSTEEATVERATPKRGWLVAAALVAVLALLSVAIWWFR